MKWHSHIFLTASTVAIFDLTAVPFAIVGAVFPDILELYLRKKHRSLHIFLSYGLPMIPAFFIHKYLFYFIFSAFLHILQDSFTVSGVKLWHGSKRPTSFGFIRTGSPIEYFIVAFVCIPLIWLATLQFNAGYVPFFYNWFDLYNQGVVDALELKKNRFNFF